jgi:hypothetical protein
MNPPASFVRPYGTLLLSSVGQAVQATSYVDKGNVQLQKALKVSGSARLYLLWFLIIASLSLLFLDWYYS